MRLLSFVLGLAFVAIAPIANVDALKCYVEGYFMGRMLSEIRTVDCDELVRALEDKANVPRGTAPKITECATGEVESREKKWIQRGCYSGECEKPSDEWPSEARSWTLHCTLRCNSDYCNGPADRNVPPLIHPSSAGSDAVTSIQPAALLIAIVGSTLAAFGI